MVKKNNNLIAPANLKTGYITVLFAAAVLYIITCAPGQVWQDSGMYQYRIWHNDIEGKLGLALSHPLYHIIGIGAKYIPLGEFGYRTNLISSIAGAFAVANLFLLLRLWLNRTLPAIIAALTLALSYTMWRHAVITESYTLYTALLSAELLMLLQYVKTKRIVFLYLLGFLNGLAIANHMLGSIAFVCYLVFTVTLVIKRKIRKLDFAAMILLWIIGALPYEYLIVRNILQTGDFWETMASAAFGTSWQGAVLNASLSSRIVIENLIMMAYNFPTPNCLFFFTGLYALKKISPSRGFTNILLALLILFFVFAFRYTIPDRYAFFIPFYYLASIQIGLGFNLLINNLPNRRILAYLAVLFALLPVPIYAITPVLAQKMNFKLPTKRIIPYRNDYVWFLQPWKTGYYGAEQFANEALDIVEDGAIIYADGTTVYPLLYAQYAGGKRRDVTIVSDHGSVNNLKKYNEEVINKLLAERPVYVVTPMSGYCPSFLLDRYEFKQMEVLWKIIAPDAISTENGY